MSISSGNLRRLVNTWLFVSISIIQSGATVLGQTYELVAPSVYAITEAPDIGDVSAIPSYRAQQVTSASEFASLPPGPKWITRIDWRLDGSVTEATTYPAEKWIVRFSTTAKTPENLDFRFAANTGPDEQVVIEGPVTLTSSNQGPIGGPKVFDYGVDLARPFLYDPSRGNLLFDLTVINGVGPLNIDFVVDPTKTAGRTLEILALDVNALEANSAFRWGGDVIQYTMIVPEPTAGVSALAGILILSIVGRRRIRLRRQEAVRGRMLWAVVATCWGCGSIASEANALDYTFGTPELVGLPISKPNYPDFGVSLSSDGLEMYYNPEHRFEGIHDNYVATRASFDAPWSEPTKLRGPVNDVADDFHPDISADGLTLIFASERKGGKGQQDLWVTTRATAQDDWGIPRAIEDLNTKAIEDEPEISPNGLELYFQRDYTDIYRSTRASTNDAWGVPVRLEANINVRGFHSTSPRLTPDGLTMFFSTDAHASQWEMNIFATQRASLADAWESPTRVESVGLNTSSVEWAGDVGADGYFYFGRADRIDAWATYDIWRVPIHAVPEPTAQTLLPVGWFLILGARANPLRSRAARWRVGSSWGASK